MKKVKFLLMMTLMMCLVGMTSYSQEQIDSYELSFFSSKVEYTVSAADSEKKGIGFYVEVPSLDRNEVSLIIEEKTLNSFKSMIDSAKSVYLKWRKTAIENNVSDLDKEIDVERVNIQCAFHYGDWNFDFSVRLKARFKVLSNGEYLLIIENRNKLQSSSNQFIDADGFIIAFSSEEEINSFLNSISKEKAEEYFNNKNSKEDLFK